MDGLWKCWFWRWQVFDNKTDTFFFIPRRKNPSTQKWHFYHKWKQHKIEYIYIFIIFTICNAVFFFIRFLSVYCMRRKTLHRRTTWYFAKKQLDGSFWTSFFFLLWHLLIQKKNVLTLFFFVAYFLLVKSLVSAGMCSYKYNT